MDFEQGGREPQFLHVVANDVVLAFRAPDLQFDMRSWNVSEVRRLPKGQKKPKKSKKGSSPPFFGEKVYRSWSCLSWSLKVVCDTHYLACVCGWFEATTDY